MDIFFSFTYYLFIIHLIRTLISWLYLWQIKEYRLDRIVVHIKETKQGKAIFFGFEPLVKLGIILFYFYTIFVPSLYFLIPILVFSIYAYESVRFGIDLVQKKVKLPIFTPKLIFIGMLSIATVFLMFLLPLLDKFFWLVFVDKFLIWIIAMYMGLFSFPSIFYKDTQINKAITKLRKHKKMKVIGITGSYGKGSTKEYIDTILSPYFNTLKTPSTHNTPIGIARTILSGLVNKTQIFIVEMGAYKIGEIAEMCEFVKPSIGILTAVNDQHVSLFGSIENTKKAKFELIESLPSNGIALFNANNENTKELFSLAKKKNKYLYYVGNKNTMKAHIYAKIVKVNPTSVLFDVQIGSKKYKNLEVNLVGAHHIQNILPGIFIAQLFKVQKKDIEKSLHDIKPLYKTMQPFIAVDNEALLIDDTYNANPASVISAAEYLSHQKGKKGLVLQPMIELGKHAKQEHYAVAKKIGSICDYLFVTNMNFNTEIKQGLLDSGNTCTLVVGSPSSLVNKIEKEFGKEDVIVFEGKDSFAVLDLISRKSIESNRQ